MRGPVPFGVLVILGVCVIACGTTRAQHRDAPVSRPLLQQQPSSPFTEEIKQLETAVDKAARRAAFQAVLDKSAQLKMAPEPLVSILVNKKPEETFKDLIEYIRDTAAARHNSFVAPLVLAANEAGESAPVAGEAVVAYDSVTDAVPIIIRMMKSELPGERAAAAAVAGRRVAGAAGAVKLIPNLISLFERNDAELSAVAMRSLTRQTWIEHKTADEWRAWIKGKSEADLLAIIADNETAARRKAEAERARLEDRYKDEAVRKLDANAGNIAAVTLGLRDEFAPVRARALELLKALLKPGLSDEVARPTIDEVGALLNRKDEPEELRRTAAALLADCGKPLLAFPHINDCLQDNGVTASLKLELVRGLNAPVAAKRLLEMLKAEVDVADMRSGAVLDQLIQQVRFVLEQDDRSEVAGAIIAQLNRLLGICVQKIDGALDGPTMKRFVDLAGRTCDGMGAIVRHRGADISPCVPSLIALACSGSAAAPSALTALRDGLLVPRAREAITNQLIEPSTQQKLGALYLRVVAGADEAMTVNLLNLYDEISILPEPVEKVTARLLEFARSTEAVLPERAGVRRTARDAFRILLARHNSTAEQHIALVNDLMLCDFGVRDVVGYFQALPPPRNALITSALKPHRADRLVRVARVLAGIAPTLTEEEREDPGFKEFQTEVNTLFRARTREDITTSLKNGVDEETRRNMAVVAGSALRPAWVPIAFDVLKANADAGDARDAVAEVLITTLKRAHPGAYENLALAGMAKANFVKALEGLSEQLRRDGYAIP